MKNSLLAKGNVEIIIRDSDNNIKEKTIVSNRIVDTGLDLLASLLIGDDDPDPIGRPLYMAIGSKSTDVTANDTCLYNEIVRRPFDDENGIERVHNSIIFQTTFPPGSTNVDNCQIAEVGMFNAPSDGVMFNRAVFSKVHLYKDDTLTIRWTITFVAALSEYDTTWKGTTPGETVPNA